MTSPLALPLNAGFPRFLPCTHTSTRMAISGTAASTLMPTSAALYGGLNCGPPQKCVHILIRGTCKWDLIWKRVFADVIQGLKIRPPWPSRVNSKSSDGFYKKWQSTGRKDDHVKTGRDWRHDATSQEDPLGPEATRNHRQHGRIPLGIYGRL